MGVMRFNKNKYVFASVPSMSLIGESAESNRAKQLPQFVEELNTYNVLLKDLVNFPIREPDRNISLNIAYYIIDDEELNKSVENQKDLPMTRLSRAVNIKVNYLQKWRDYILAYYIIISNNKYKAIQDYFRIKLSEDNKVVNLPIKKSNLHQGIVMRAFKKSAYVISSSGEFLKLEANRRRKVGELLEGREKRGVRNYKIHISIALVIFIFVCCAIVIEYRRIQSIVVIGISSNVKLHVNKFDKVIYAYSPTEKGKKLISNSDILDQNIDDAMEKVFDYALHDEMIDCSKKTLITINGKEMKYGELSKTNKFLTDNNIPILINNAGSQQKLPQNLFEEEKAEGKK